MANSQLSVYFFAQAAIIVLASQLVGALARRLGQPQVVGEMIAGVLLGPSLFGLVMPQWQQTLFPPSTMGTLYVVAQLGVGLYMFLVGTEFRVDHFRSCARSAVGVSMAGILAPFALVGLLAPWIIQVPGLFAPKVQTSEAILFLGAAIAITAFPMLARIIQERGLSGTAIGTLALTAGAFDDAAAWCILAIVLASFGGAWINAVVAISGALTFSVVMILYGPRLFRWLALDVPSGGEISPRILATVLVLFLASAFAMDAIGIHAVFGGFLLGVVLPRGALVVRLRETLRPLVVVFLLPMFFTYSGLNTRLDLLFDLAVLPVALLIIVVSFGSKGVACGVVARLTGAKASDALAIGALMNARGLMELIIINIGLAAGVILPGLFSMLVLMAIVTTLAATPLFSWSLRLERRRPDLTVEVAEWPATP